VRKDILEVLEAKTTEEVAQSEALTLTPSFIQARLQMCGFPHGDLSDFRISGTRLLCSPQAAGFVLSDLSEVMLTPAFSIVLSFTPD